MSFTPWAGRHGPRKPREPGEVLIGRPVLGNVRFSEGDHLKLVSVGVFKELDVNPSAADQRVVAAGQREAAGHEPDVCPKGELMSACPAQYEGVGAGAPLGPGTRLNRPIYSGIKDEHNGKVVHKQDPLPLRPHRASHTASHGQKLTTLSKTVSSVSRDVWSLLSVQTCISSPQMG